MKNYEMRRANLEADESTSKQILVEGSYGILSTVGEDGFPYGVPVNYAYDGDKIYFHCAKVGHKIDAIKSNERVSLSIIESDEIIEEKFTNKYKSVIVFGKARIIEDKNEIFALCVQMTKNICANMSEGDITQEANRFINETAMVEITPQHITGKEGLEFYRLRG